MSEVNIDGIKSMLSSIQQGHWSWDKADGNVWCEDDDGNSCIVARVIERGERWATDNPTANGLFLMAAPKLIAQLIAEVERLSSVPPESEAR